MRVLSNRILRLIVRTLGSATRQLLVLTLVVAIGPTAPLLAQAAAVSQSTATTPMSLHITILDGEDALNSIRERTAREPIVEVDDENHKPVAGALVLFAIQDGSNGAGATFAGSSTITVQTGADGRAVAHGLLPNRTTGQYTITVTATAGALAAATAIIHQGNVVTGGTPPSPPDTGAFANTASGGSIGQKVGLFSRIPKKYYFIGGGIVVAGTVLAVTLTRGNSPTTITAGTGTVGP